MRGELWITDHGLRITDYGLRITDYGLRITKCGSRDEGSGGVGSSNLHFILWEQAQQLLHTPYGDRMTGMPAILSL
jgi:hypothetical protein